MFDDVLDRFVERAPAAVMVRALLERLLNAERIDAWFDSVCQIQHTKKILFSSLVQLMMQVVCRTQPSVNAAYRKTSITASIVAVYSKLRGIELSTSQGLVREMAQGAADIIDEIGGALPELLPGYRIRYLDGNCLEASEHRLGFLRNCAAAPLPGKCLVVFDAARRIISDVFPCADGHAQERSLLAQVLPRVQAGELWIGDRNFCVTRFLAGIARQGAFFIIRHHIGMSVRPLEAAHPVAGDTTGRLLEQAVQITDEEGHTWTLRRIIVKLDKPTRKGDKTLNLLTNLPVEAADAATIAELYRTRWTIETAFQKLEAHLNSEINPLGYPQAALFGFCLSLVAYNLYAVVMAALRAAHPETDIDNTVSEYYLANEIANTTEGLNIAVKEHQWELFAQASHTQFCAMLLDLARKVDLKAMRKNHRGPKKPLTKRTRYKDKPHVSTAKLLAAAG
jgi:IS4 transposase